MNGGFFSRISVDLLPKLLGLKRQCNRAVVESESAKTPDLLSICLELTHCMHGPVNLPTAV